MSLTSGVKLHIHLLNVVVRFIVFLTSATLIFRGTDMLKCFRASLGIRDNESRLYNIDKKKNSFVSMPTQSYLKRFLFFLNCCPVLDNQNDKKKKKKKETNLCVMLILFINMCFSI